MASVGNCWSHQRAWGGLGREASANNDKRCVYHRLQLGDVFDPHHLWHRDGWHELTKLCGHRRARLRWTVCGKSRSIV